MKCLELEHTDSNCPNNTFPFLKNLLVAHPKESMQMMG